MFYSPFLAACCRWLSRLLLPLLALILVACGGGGGGGGTNTNLPMLSVTPEEIRTIVGGTAPTQTPEQIGMEFEAVLQSATSLLISDIHLFSNRMGERTDSACTGDTCTFTEGSNSQTLDIPMFRTQYSTANPQYEPVTTANGVPLAQSRSRIQPDGGMQEDLQSYGGWLTHSYFAVGESNTGNGNEIEVSGWSVGIASGSNPSADGGGATWTGAMVGTDTVSPTSPYDLVQGEVLIDIDNFDNPDVDVSFTNISSLDSGNMRSTVMNWNNIPLNNGSFATGSERNQIEGRFYGTSHDEVGGVFERDDIVGAFGAKRE